MFNNCNFKGISLKAYLDQLTDEEFEQYLHDKYGKFYAFKSLLTDEYNRLPPIFEEKFIFAFKEGAKAKQDIEEYNRYIQHGPLNNKIRYR